MGERWEGPYKVKGFDEERGGYFFSLQKSGLVRVYLTSVFLLLSVPRCFGDQKPQFDFFKYKHQAGNQDVE